MTQEEIDIILILQHWGMIAGLVTGFVALVGLVYRILKWAIALDNSIKDAHKCIERIEKKINKLLGEEGTKD